MKINILDVRQIRKLPAKTLRNFMMWLLQDRRIRIRQWNDSNPQKLFVITDDYYEQVTVK